MTNKPGVLIVGAGPTGLTAAVELARRGFTPRIIDRDEKPTSLSKAVGISSHSLDVLEPSGVTERLLANGIRIYRAHFWFNGHQLGAFDFSGLPHRFNFLLSLPQSDTETIMVDILAGFGVAVEWRTLFVALERSGGEIHAALEGPAGQETAVCEFLFGADGVQSAVRKALAFNFEGYTHHRTWSIADAEIADWPYEPGAAHAFLHPNGDVGFIIPIGKDRFRAVSNTDNALARVPGNYRIVQVLRTDQFRIPIRQAPRYQDGNVFLGGDAAHVHSPVGARGMNLGIEDAASFARRLAANDLAGYTAERHPIGHQWIRLSETLLSAAQASNPLLTTFRNLAFGIVGHVHWLQRPMLERVAGLKE
ncbi:FAD-dependent monooxygenase [Mesorhizobium sp. BAC0120]|uniref:FAD-dependent oxidoreductase n=1 Tax=Mesorhizobium sp. BAC0120 TaxID=3090670 RepID=UPI00298C791F|nr:FAD-dependent monooxygenase [Mesorhizobium sp. BAC0120]MDW6023622.1 FAD-dependent monooxygenase [Mesorhizobium sp. BAC0120]